MKRHIVVTLISVTTTTDDLGDETTASTSTTYDRVRFAPRSSSEGATVRTPKVITAASLLRRGDFPVDADDTIVIADQDPSIDGTWQVEGEVGRWASGVEVAITRTA